MKKYILLLLTGLFTLQIYAQIASSGQNQRYYDINKNIDIFNSVLRELDMFYVDSIEVNKLVQGTIHNMLSRLDPYTEYYSEDRKSTRLNSSHVRISYAVFCLKKKKK